MQILKEKIVRYETDGSIVKGYDAGELVRCKDCIYWKRYCRIVNGVTSNHVCGRKRELDGTMHRTKADDFCSWAMRAKE